MAAVGTARHFQNSAAVRALALELAAAVGHIEYYSRNLVVVRVPVCEWEESFAAATAVAEEHNDCAVADLVESYVVAVAASGQELAARL